MTAGRMWLVAQFPALLGNRSTAHCEVPFIPVPGGSGR